MMRGIVIAIGAVLVAFGLFVIHPAWLLVAIGALMINEVA